jgi:hypothetical protein
MALMVERRDFRSLLWCFSSLSVAVAPRGRRISATDAGGGRIWPCETSIRLG